MLKVNESNLQCQDEETMFQWYLSIQQLSWWQWSLYLIKVLKQILIKLEFDTKDQVLSFLPSCQFQPFLWINFSNRSNRNFEDCTLMESTFVIFPVYILSKCAEIRNILYKAHCDRKLFVQESPFFNPFHPGSGEQDNKYIGQLQWGHNPNILLIPPQFHHFVIQMATL